MSENGEDFDPEYQKGRTGVEHRNIDAATGEHPFGEDPQSFEADLRHLIRKVADDLYQSWEATVREYLANAETATLKVDEWLEDNDALPYDDLIVDGSYEPKIEVTWNRKENKLVIKDNGIGMAASEVDEIFRQIGHSAARDDGGKSGQFGMGALSFVKLVGLDNAMIMTSHSRLNDDNAAYYVTLAGVEPIRGQLDDDEYGTKFQMTPKGSFDIRETVSKYAEWMRVPVIYREVDEDGTEVFNEDWGDKSLYEDYDENRVTLGLEKENAFEAFCSPEAGGQTLLLSMDIDRNDGRHSPGQHGAPFPFDVRLLDESGKVIESSNGNEGLMPCPRSDYEQMLVEARDPHITRDLLNNGDVVGSEVEDGPNEGSTVVKDSVLDGGKPLPPGDYITESELAEDDVLGNDEVIIGPNQGKVIVNEYKWEQMDAGRAELYVPEEELDSYNLESGEGDLTLPEPTSDRDRLQSHATFWKYLGKQFAEQFNEQVDEVYDIIKDADDPLERIMELEPENLSLALRAIRKLPSGRRRSTSNIAAALLDHYGITVPENVANTFYELYRAPEEGETLEAFDNADLAHADYEAALANFEEDFDDPSDADVIRKLSTTLPDGHAPRGMANTSKKSNRSSEEVANLVNKAHPDGTVYMAKSTGGAYPKKSAIAWDLHDDNVVAIVDEYEQWEDLLGWEKLKQFPHGKNEIREELGDELSDSLLEDIAPESDDSGGDDGASSTTARSARKNVEDKVLNVARGARHRNRTKYPAETIKEQMSDPDDELGGYKDIMRLILFPSDTDRNMTNHWWIPGTLPTGGYAAIANCTNTVYDYLEDVDGVHHIDDYIDQASEYTFESNRGEMTLARGGDDLVVHVVEPETKERLMQETVFEELPNVIPEYYNESKYSNVEFPAPDDMIYAPIVPEDLFWLRPELRKSTKSGDGRVVLKGNVNTRDLGGGASSMSSDYKLYSRARLPDWDFDWKELEVMDEYSYRVSLNEGGYELIETLGLLHDEGKKPFSETPKARWSK